MILNNGGFMSDGKSIVVTVYGHNKTIDDIAVSSFEGNESNAETYCDTINSLELKEDTWVLAKQISENEKYPLNRFIPFKFDMILTLDDRAIQKILREIDSQVLAEALKGEKEAIQEKIFNNMSKRAAQMLKEDIEYMGPVRITDVKETQEKIIMIIHHFEETGEIVIPHSKGETVE
jgi:flagellar motor switch protein FliG